MAKYLNEREMDGIKRYVMAICHTLTTRHALAYNDCDLGSGRFIWGAGVDCLLLNWDWWRDSV